MNAIVNSSEKVDQLKQVHLLKKEQVESLIQRELDDSEYVAIQKGQLPGAAFLLKEVEWGFVSELTGKRFEELIIELRANGAFVESLNSLQRCLLEDYAMLAKTVMRAEKEKS